MVVDRGSEQKPGGAIDVSVINVVNTVRIAAEVGASDQVRKEPKGRGTSTRGEAPGAVTDHGEAAYPRGEGGGGCTTGDGRNATNDNGSWQQRLARNLVGTQSRAGPNRGELGRIHDRSTKEQKLPTGRAGTYEEEETASEDGEMRNICKKGHTTSGTEAVESTARGAAW